jgi:glycosyltransferase involved in cell wall biosynthesis
MEKSLVSVVCLCYNQERFVEEAIRSVLNQTYSNIQLIVVDDASTDNSVNVIKSVISAHPAIQFLFLKENFGNCKAFNKGLALTKGSFIIDLAADDVLLSDRIEKGVQVLLEKGESYGVHFSDAAIIDEHGTHLYNHSDQFPHQSIPQGNVYKGVISRYFICPPTVMFSRQVANVLGGYDETLSYEDFDFWIRSSRAFNYAYSPDVLVKRRISKNALSKKQFKLFSKHSDSTYKVCEKILRLNNSREEQQALQHRILYEIKLNLRLLNAEVVLKFFFLLIRNEQKKYS